MSSHPNVGIYPFVTFHKPGLSSYIEDMYRDIYLA